VSGPLAAWVGKHAEGSWRAVLVVKELALDCYPDGRPARPVTRDQLRARTRVGMTTIREGLAEARELGRAGERGGVLQLDHGGGRGLSSLYRVLVELCPAEAGCRECDALRPNRPEETGRQAPRLVRQATPNRAPRDKNRAPGGRNRAPGAPPTETGNGSPPQGGTVTHPESSAALAPDGAALEPGQEQEQAENGEPAPAVDFGDFSRLLSLVNPGRPERPRSSAEEREAEEQEKRARALRLVAEDSDWQAGVPIEEGHSA
jgi:hypothetical protein